MLRLIKRCHVRSRYLECLECSRSATLDEPWVQADISDVMSIQQPGEETLQAQTISAVRTGAVLPLNNTHSLIHTHRYRDKNSCRPSPGQCTSSRGLGRFPPSCIPPAAPQRPRYASSLQLSLQHLASKHRPAAQNS